MHLHTIRGGRMGTREQLVEHLWREVILPLRDPRWIDNVLANYRRAPDSIGAAGAALERLLAAGASRRDLSLLAQLNAYESVFGTLYALGDPGVDGDDVFGLYELMASSPSADFGDGTA
jgi:hypothetical protein